MQSVIFFVALLLASPAWSAVPSIVNTPSALNTNTGGPVLTMNFQCNSGTTGLLVFIGSYGTVAAGPVTTITSATYNGAALTVATFSPGTGAEDATILYLANPTVGSSQTLNVNYSPDNPFGAAIQPVCVKDVDTTSMVGNINQSYNSSVTTSVSDSITVAAGNVAFDVVTLNSILAPTAAGSQTQITNVGWGGTEQVSSSYLQDATAMGWSFVGTFRVAHAVVEVKASAGGGTTPSNTQIMWNQDQVFGSWANYFEMWRNSKDGPNGIYNKLATVPDASDKQGLWDQWLASGGNGQPPYPIYPMQYSFTDSTAEAFCYKVKGCNDTGCSPLGNFVCVGYPNLPGKPAVTIQ